MTTATPPRFDEIEKHPDDAITADTFYRLRAPLPGEPVPADFEAAAEQPLHEGA